VAELTRAITAINRDIERVKLSRSYMVIETLAAFARQNPAVTATTVIAGTLGIAAHALGCAALSVGAAAARDVAKRIGWLRKTEAGSRLGRKVQSDVQPLIDKVIAKVVRASPVAMHVLSLRNTLSDVSKHGEKRDSQPKKPVRRKFSKA
jgi:hypothetical protein